MANEKSTRLFQSDILPITMKGIKSISETPYGNPGSALAELIDNSWERGYCTTRTDIFSVYENKKRGELKRILVIDNGPGMSQEIIQKCFTIGSETEKSDETLGLYGMGQKSACLWLGNKYTIHTKREDGPLYVGSFSYSEGLVIDQVDDGDVNKWFSKAVGGNHGTVVTIDEVRTNRFKKTKNGFTKDIMNSHGVIFSEMIKKGADMYVNGEKIEYIHFLDFDISIKISDDDAVFTLTDSEGVEHKIPYEAWYTPDDKESKQRTDILHRTYENQGFICLRNDRVVGNGQLLGVIKTKNNIYNGLRIILRLDGSTDSYLGISFGKTQRGEITNDDIQAAFVKEFKKYFNQAKVMQNEAIRKGETTEDYDKAVTDVQKELSENSEIQDALKELKCNAEALREKREKKEKTVTDQVTEDENIEEEKKKNEREKRHRKPRTERLKTCGSTFDFPVMDMGSEAPYFEPTVNEKGHGICIINSDHNYWKNYMYSLPRTSLIHPLKEMAAEWLTRFGKDADRSEESMEEFSRSLATKSNYLSNLYSKKNQDVLEDD